MNDAGQPLLSALENLQASLRGADRLTLGRMIHRVRKGGYLSAAMAVEGLAPLDVALIKVGEQSGTLSETERYLVQFYEERHELERSIKRALVKPAGLFVMSLFLRDLPAVIGGTISGAAYFMRTGGVLAGVAVAAIVVFHFYRASYRSRIVADAWSKFFLRIPWFGRVVRTVAYERFFTTLSIGLNSGLDLSSMLELGASMTSLPALRAGAARILQRTQKTGLAKAFEESGLFRSDQLLMLRTGEQAGQLDEAFRKITSDLRSELKSAIQTFEEWLPKIVYAVAMGYSILGISSSYQDMWKNQEKLLHLGE